MLMIGIAGTALAAHEQAWLQHEACAGVVLFARNIVSPEQVAKLTARLRAAAPRPILIAIDQEGGPVQRLRDGYTALPALQRLGVLWRDDPPAALQLAREHAWLMASEVRASGIDLSFAPVADLGCGNRAIGERAFSADPEVVASFVAAYVRAMHDAGMAATLKHFPGHGSVLEDTHYDVALDCRCMQDIRDGDLLPFQAGIDAGADAVMMGHVIYPEIAPEPAGMSRYWIEQVLRAPRSEGGLGFRGVVFSDDIGMAAVQPSGSVAARVIAHLDAGCDVVLVCHPELVDAALEAVRARPTNAMALLGLVGRGPLGWDALLADDRRGRALDRLRSLPALDGSVESGVSSGAVSSGEASGGRLA